MINTNYNYKNLYTTKASPQDLESVAKTMLLWRKIGQDKALLCREPRERCQFLGCARLCQNCYHDLTNPLWSKILGWLFGFEEHPLRNPLDGLHLCIDEEGTLQGFMQISYLPNNSLYIEQLVTHPHNIRSPVNSQEPSRRQGVGSLLLHHAEQMAIEQNKDAVTLDSTDSALSFYLKKKFTNLGDGCMIKRVQKIASPVLNSLAA